MNNIHLAILGSKPFSNIINELEFSNILNSKDQFNHNDKKTSVGELADTFNDIRDENLIRKTKELESKGYKVIAPVGDGHIDLLKNKNQK